jgi:hypothetical protein
VNDVSAELSAFAARATEYELRELVRRLATVQATGFVDGRETRWAYDLDDVRAALSGCA